MSDLPKHHFKCAKCTHEWDVVQPYCPACGWNGSYEVTVQKAEKPKASYLRSFGIKPTLRSVT